MSTAQALQRHLDGRWSGVRATVRALSERELFRPESGLPTVAHRARTLLQLRSLADAGLTQMGFDERYGGQGDLGASITAFDMLGMGDLSLLVKTGVQFGLFGGAVAHLGTERHHREYLSDIANGRLLGCFAMTEHGHGSDVAGLQTTATFDRATDEFVICTPTDDARKDYIGNAADDGRVAVVFAQLITGGIPHGVHAFLVPLRDEAGAVIPGVRIADSGLKAGLNGVDNGQLWFDGARIPRDNLLDRYGQVLANGSYRTPIEDDTKRFFTMLGTLIQGRISVAGASVSATKVALTLAGRYAQRRTQFTAPGHDQEIVVMDYLSHQRKLLPPLARTYALHFAQGELVEMLHEVLGARALASGDAVIGDDPRRRQLETRAAGIKAMATWHATNTIQVCREACGGAGYLASNRLADLKADTDVFTTFEGDNTVLLQLVAKELLTAYGKRIKGLGLAATVRFGARQTLHTALDRTPLRDMPARLAARSATAFDDRDWQLAMLAFREQRQVEALAWRMRRADGAAATGDPAGAVNAVQDQLLSTARAHVDHVLLQAFVAGIASCPDAAAAAALSQLCDLFALSTIEADRAWYLERGRLSAARSRQLAGAVNDLCGVLRPQLGELLDAFGIPPAMLDVPMLREQEG
ncbi:MAG: acyl-CoA oxidase [Frankiales bacterium]|nr:acyl-CoA oxidase [Frankiales bacterium]